MTKSRKRISKKAKIQIAVISIAVLAIAGYLVWDIVCQGPLVQLFTNRERLTEIVRGSGVLAPVIYILLEIAQTIIAPIPGNIVGFIGGYIFGWWGVLWTVIGSGLGFLLVFWLSRRFGRPFVEKFVKKELLQKFDFVFGEHGAFILFMIFLIPGLPDDIVCYLAGLTEIPIKKLMIMIMLGRLPSIVVTNYLGVGLESGNLVGVTAIAVITVVILGIIYWQQETILKLLKNDQQQDATINRLQQANLELMNDINDLADDGKLNNSNQENQS